MMVGRGDWCDREKPQKTTKNPVLEELKLLFQVEKSTKIALFQLKIAENGLEN